MIDVELTEKKLIVHVRGIDKLLAFKSTLEIELEHVTGVEEGISAELWDELKSSIRVGTALGTTIAGSFRHHGEWMFWDIHNPGKAFTIHVAHETYKKVVLETEDPKATVAQIRARLTAK